MTLEQALIAAVGALAAAVTALFWLLQKSWAERAGERKEQAGELRELVLKMVDAIHEEQDVVKDLRMAVERIPGGRA